jgi:hypothetical protein
LVKWINRSAQNETIFWRDIFTKLLPLTVSAQVHHDHDFSGAKAELQRLVSGVIAAKEARPRLLELNGRKGSAPMEFEMQTGLA